MNNPRDRAHDELLPDAALGWTDGGDADACTALLQNEAARAELADIERVAALTAMALVPPTEPASQAHLVLLTAKLHADAVTFFAATRSPGPRVRPFRELLPWLLAAASLVMLLWPIGSAGVPAQLARAELLRSGAELVQCAWQPGPSPRRGTVQGDVVWDASRQQGYLRLRGLPVLAATQRYQLWIVDADRQGPPVDGGLLTLPANDGEVVVPVQARLPVRHAAAFVLTIEPAAGVVVSAQEDVVAIAKP